jgi:hypothetical protein
MKAGLNALRDVVCDKMAHAGFKIVFVDIGTSNNTSFCLKCDSIMFTMLT